jgi:hypothetical protein
MMDLAGWQERLVRHFSQMRMTRQATGGDRPIFALEHGLDPPEAQALAEAVRAHIGANVPSGEHALPWIVYAAEIGYRYSGDEYWQTFEEETPGWTVRGNRSWIRDCYRSFHENYGGAKPSGAWADHFSIICWPITHAILPRDLQRQLARILYELRHSFSSELFEAPSTLGEFIAARSWNATSRFQNLAQETDLVGQIAVALLLQGEPGTASLIHPAALQRISEDLDRERRAREWLRTARRSAQERARIRGLMFGRAKTTPVHDPDGARTEVASLGIEPRLILRPKAPAGASWEASLEIPDLSHLLFRFPKTRDILMGSRCLVAGASGRPLARGRCLHGVQRIILSRWPRPDEVLLRFEQTDTQLEYLLRTECLLRPGPLWLFRIASDGLAYEARSLRVRPGERYIIVSTDRPVASNSHTGPIHLECEGVHGAILELPGALTKEWEETVQSLGLGQAKAIEVWPAGLAAVVWDGEGHGEWLASERPCLAIRSDHQIAALLVSMQTGAEPSLELPSIEPGEPVFVELPQLPVGLHTVHVSARSSPTAEAEVLGDLNVVMRIREARPWSPGASPQGPLDVQVDPVAPTLEQLWEGRVEITLRGPAGRQVKCRISLHDTGPGTTTVAKHLPPIALPVTPAVWKRHFEKHFQSLREASLAYDTARICDIEFNAEELGRLTVRCEREFTPLRWAIRRSGQGYIARLLDDSGDPEPPEVARLAFETPCIEEALEPAPSYPVPSAGGLYIASRQGFTAAIIVPPSVRRLEDLHCTPRIDEDRERSTHSALRVLGFAQLWAQARLPGDLVSAIRQRLVLRTLTMHIFRLIGGDRWAAAEQSVAARGDGIADIKGAISKRHEWAAIGAALALDCGALAAATSEERVSRIASLATRYGLLPSASCQDPTAGGKASQRSYRANEDDPCWLSELALRLASDPANVKGWAGEQQVRAGVTRLFEVPTLARAARFLVLATDRHLKSHAAPGELYANWGWS